VAQFVVRNIENSVKAGLKRRAERHGRSMEEEVRYILRDAVHERGSDGGGLGTSIAALFRDFELDGEIPELRGHTIKPPRFDK
jgi:plasmid stability protein